MLFTLALLFVLLPVMRLLAVVFALDVVMEKTFNLIAKYKDWLWAGVFIMGAWWLFWR